MQVTKAYPIPVEIVWGVNEVDSANTNDPYSERLATGKFAMSLHV